MLLNPNNPNNHCIRRTFFYRFCVLTVFFLMKSFWVAKTVEKRKFWPVFLNFLKRLFWSLTHVMKRCPNGSFRPLLREKTVSFCCPFRFFLARLINLGYKHVFPGNFI